VQRVRPLRRQQPRQTTGNQVSPSVTGTSGPAGRVQAAQAAGGDLDPTFGIGGKVTTDLRRSTDIANAVAIQADGKLVVVDLDVGRINTVECACGDSRRV